MKIYFYSVLIFCFSFSQGQTVQWAQKGGGPSTDIGKSIAVDPAGNSYVVGTFQNNITFAPYSLTGPVIPTNSFIAKYNNSGNIQWVQQITAASNNSIAGIVYCAAQNCIYIGGKFFGPTTFGAISLTPLGNTDCFFAKYDLSGNCLWVIKGGSINGDEMCDIDCDLAGNLIATGWTMTGAAFGSFIVPPHNLLQTFTTSISPTGIYQWLTISCYTSGSSAAAPNPVIKTDPFLNIYISGLFNANCIFGSQNFSALGVTGNINVFIQKLSPAGVILWTVPILGTGTVDVAGIGTDITGNIILTGSFRTTIDFGGISKTALGSAAYNDIYLAKYRPTGSLLWVSQFGSTDQDYGKSVDVLSNGNILIAGSFLNSTQIGSYAFSGITTDCYVALCSPAGIPFWANSYGGSGGDVFNCVATNNVSIYATGNFTGTASTYGSFVLTATGNNDASIVKIALPSPLPVELIAFTALPGKGQKEVNCSWTTASELNNDYFTLEKSRNGLDFITLSTVAAKLQTSTYQNYDYTDHNAFDGISYYRLSQTDYNGKKEMLKTVAVQFRQQDALSFNCYYSTDNNGIQISSNSLIDEVYLLNTNGQQIKHLITRNSASPHVLVLPDVSDGLYLVQLISGNETAVEKIVVLR